MRRVTRLAGLAMLASSTALTPLTVLAEEAVIAVDEVTVYATRNAQSTFTVPAMVDTIDTGAAGAALANDTSDLFEFTPGIEVEGGARRNGQTLTLRGFDSDAIITLFDGRRQNFEAAHDGKFFIDPALLKRVEVVKGASSAIYGGGAIGGIVAFETVNAADLLAPEETMGAMSSFGLRTANREKSTSHSVYGRTGDLDWLANVSFIDDESIRLGDASKLQSENQVLSGLVKGEVTLGDWHSVALDVQLLNNDSREPNNGQQATGSSNPIVDKRIEDRQAGIRYRYENPDETWLNPELHFFVNDTFHEETDLSGTNQGRVQTRALQTIGFTANNRQSAFDFAGAAHSLTWGVELYTDQQQGTNTAEAGGKRASSPDAETLNWGIFLQDDIAVETAFGAVQVIPAMRFDQYSSEDEQGRQQNEHAISPKISSSLMPADGLLLFGSLAQAFRAPKMTEIYADGVHFTIPDFGFGDIVNNFIPNPDLKPETVTTIEFGAGYEFGQSGEGKQSDNKGHSGHIKGAVFYSHGKDFISQFTDNPNFLGIDTTTKIENVPEAILKGIELEASYNVGQFRSKTGFHMVYAKNGDTGASLDGSTVAPTLTTDIGWVLPNHDSIVGVRSRFASEYESGSTVRDGYGVHDAYWQWQPDQTSFVVDLGVENLFDKAYRKRSPAFEEGRSINLQVGWKW